MKKINISTEQLEEFASASLDKTELATKLGFTFSNGKVSSIIDSLLLEHSIDVSHFNRYNKNKRKFLKVTKTCPICKVEFETLLGISREKTTCSTKCANTFFKDKMHTEESKKKVSESLKKYYKSFFREKVIFREKITFTMYNGKRIICKNITTTLIKKKCNFCNKSCKTEHNMYCSIQCKLLDPVHRKKLCEKAQARVANGNNKGWSTRSKLKPSYAEQYIIDLLKDQLPNVQYVRELKVGKWFVDFAFGKIALEIDGRQHLLPERMLSDQNKDEYLRSQGWSVVRIPWQHVTLKFREEIISKLNNIVDLSKSENGVKI